MTRRQATLVLLPFSFSLSAFVFVVSLILLYMIPLLLSFTWVGSISAYFEPLLLQIRKPRIPHNER
jgi:hypothetical protein